MSHKVQGCYIFTALDDYSFLGELRDLCDIYIKDAWNLKDLTFLRELEECGMLHIHKAHLKDLEEICSLKKRSRKPFNTCMSCLCLDDCIVDDYGAIFEGGIRFAELIMFQPELSPEKLKLLSYLKPIPAYKFRYHRFKETTDDNKVEAK